MRLSLKTTLGLMGVVACIAVVLAAYLAYESGDGSPVLGLMIILACTAGVTAIRMADSIRECRAVGQPVTVRRRSMVILKASGIAILVVSLADSTFLLTYGLVVGGSTFSLHDPRARDIIPEGLVAGAGAAVVVCYLSAEDSGVPHRSAEGSSVDWLRWRSCSRCWART